VLKTYNDVKENVVYLTVIDKYCGDGLIIIYEDLEDMRWGLTVPSDLYDRVKPGYKLKCLLDDEGNILEVSGFINKESSFKRCQLIF
jgi:hypothetical protein